MVQGGQSGEDASGEEGSRSVRAHSAAMTVLQRSPFRSDLILTMGAWTFAVWMDGALRAPLCQSPAAPAMYSAGCWSPARPGRLSIQQMLSRASAAHCPPTQTKRARLLFILLGRQSFVHNDINTGINDAHMEDCSWLLLPAAAVLVSH